MLVKEIMSKHPDALSDEMTIKQAATEMQKFDFGFLPVKHQDRIVGVVTDRDLVLRTIATGQDPSKTKLKDAMTKSIYFCHEDDDLVAAITVMSTKQVNRLAVYNKDEKFTGVISLGDIARKSKDAALLAKVTQAIHRN